MTKLIDIQRVITKLLKDNFQEYDIIVEPQAEDVTSPTFFVDVRPVYTNMNRRDLDKTINVDITYVEGRELLQENNNIVCDTFQEIFFDSLKVNNKHIPILKLSFSQPSFLVCSFTLRVIDFVNEINDKPYMNDLKYNVK